MKELSHDKQGKLNKVEKSRRAGADLRIQKRDVFAKICTQPIYTNFGPQESSIFRRLVHKFYDKDIGKALLEDGAEQLEAPNKGYPDGFTNYTTFDEEHNINYLRNLQKKMKQQSKILWQKKNNNL